jgi:predicted secreted protein
MATAVAAAPSETTTNSPQKSKEQKPQLVVQQPLIDNSQALASATQLYGNYLNFSSLTAEEVRNFYSHLFSGLYLYIS